MKDGNHTGGRGIVLIANCSQGTADAARFAVEHLFDTHSTLVFLQTYDFRINDHGRSASFESRLESIARRELEDLRSTIRKQYRLPADSLHVKVEQGPLPDTINDLWSRFTELAVVVGPGSETPGKKLPCMNIIHDTVESNARPIFLVTDTIAVIEEKRVLVLAGKQKPLSLDYLGMMDEWRKKLDFTLEITTGKHNGTRLSTSTLKHFTQRKIETIADLNS
jgi:hypothetical protein